MNKQEYKKATHKYRREQHNHNSSSRSHLPCGDQDAAFDRHEQYMERLIDENPVLRAFQYLRDTRDQLAWKAADKWNLRHHYLNLKKRNRRKAS